MVQSILLIWQIFEDSIEITGRRNLFVLQGVQRMKSKVVFDITSKFSLSYKEILEILEEDLAAIIVI